MQSQCCLHNIVGDHISLSRIAEFGAKSLVTVLCVVVAANGGSTCEIKNKRGSQTMNSRLI
jgi:hypothetical protein